MRIHAVIITLFMTVSGFSQETVQDRPNGEINIEMGLNARGLIGLGYTQNFGYGMNGHWSCSASGGVGIYWEDGGWFPSGNASFIGTLSPSYNFGTSRDFLTLGGEIKYMYTERPYEGTGFGGYVGYKFAGDSGFIFNFRVGVVKWLGIKYGDGPGLDLIPEEFPLPAAGLSVGWRL